MQVSGSENHHLQPWFEASSQRRASEEESLGPASAIGGFSFAGLMQQAFAATAGGMPASPVAVSSLAATPSAPGSQTPAPISTVQQAVGRAPTPAVVAAPAAVADTPTVAIVPAAAVADTSTAATVPAAAAVAATPTAAAVSTPAAPGTSSTASPTPSANPEDPPGTGQVTASGAPLIVLSAAPSWDARNCTGPEIYNPYYGTATSPTRPGYVTGFDNWFQTITMGPPTNGALMPAVSATEEGAQEALRLVQQYIPGATIVNYTVTGQVGEQVSHAIELPDGTMMNAGLILDSYYNQGCGVDSTSDALLKQFMDLPAGAQPVTA
ncbi:MAG: hypothetical protein ACLQGV_10160 [Bryobacteraceae bacterium]